MRHDRRRALLFLAFTEAWERFSYYGMSAVLVLYMNQALFQPGRIGDVAGLGVVRGWLEALYGPLSPLALASQVYGLYAGLIYFTPVLGGLVADRWTGRRPAVLAGATLMSGGHIAMAFDGTFLLALLLLIVGCGLLKGNISTQVGALYPRDDAAGRTQGFAIFSMAINAGAVLGPLLIAWLADRFGWHWGFATAGAMMLCGLATYLAGYRHLPPDPPRAVRLGPVTAGDWRTVGVLVAVIAITVFQSVAYLQNGNIGLVWIAGHVDLDLGGFRVPVGWFSACDPIASIAFVPVLALWWRWRKGSEMGRIATGAALTAAANLVLLAAGSARGGVSIGWPIAYEVLLGIAFLHYWPTLLALVSRGAPPRIAATMIGCVFLSLFVAGLLIGALGSAYERWGAPTFWAVNAGIAAAGWLLAVAAARPITRLLAAAEPAG
ncbi:peptide MFS transporter [Sphingomonas sp. CLY1604]|uniref:peptide MFS transporter n=1 Tax=Sphingomonas sp. CLY1604 TaxID=3457786 RepID=UPI003FD6CD40